MSATAEREIVESRAQKPLEINARRARATGIPDLAMLWPMLGRETLSEIPSMQFEAFLRQHALQQLSVSFTGEMEELIENYVERVKLVSGLPQIQVTETSLLRERYYNGVRILREGLLVFAALLLLSIIAMLFNTFLSLAGIYFSLSVLLFFVLAFWLETKMTIFNPRYLAAGIVGTLGLAVSAVIISLTA